MPFAAAAISILFCLAHLPVCLALVISDKGCAAAFRPVSPKSALNAALKRSKGIKKPVRRKKAEKTFSRMMLPLRKFSTLRAVLPYITIDLFHISVIVGLDDAAHTALFCGFLTSAAHMINSRALDGHVRITPDFNSPRLEGHLHIVLTLRMNRALSAAARTALSAKENTPIIRALRAFHRIKNFRPAHTTPGR